MNLATLLNDRAACHPERVALLDRQGGRWRATTYRQLEQASQRLAAYWHHQGLQPGDGVLLWQPPSRELYAAIAALLHLGLVGIVAAPGAELARQLALYPPRAFFGNRRAHLLRWREPLLRQISCALAIGGWPGAASWQAIQQAEDLGTAPLFAATPATPALLSFTSGSTGQPKALLRRHGLLQAQFQALQPVFAWPETAVEATALPLFVLPSLAAGLTVLLPPVNWRAPGRSSAARAIAALQHHRATRLLAAPGWLQTLVDGALARGVTLPDLAQIFLGGAPVLPSLLAQLQQVAPAAAIAAVYGATEAEPIASLRCEAISPADLARVRAGGGLPAGRPVAAIQVRILQPQRPARPASRAAEFARCQMPAGEPGEIAVSGAHVLADYWGTEPAGRVLQVGATRWLCTGDAGYFDAQGRLWLLGRCQGRVGSLYPLAVEAIANNTPGVRRSAFVDWEGEPVLLVEAAGPVRWGALQQAIAPLGPIRLQRCRRLPVDRRHNAKLDYAALGRWLARRRRR